MQPPPSYQQNATGTVTCPPQGTFYRKLIKSPLVWWRMGLGPVLERSMQVLTTWESQDPYPTLDDACLHHAGGW
jgi:hypothetical protein